MSRWLNLLSGSAPSSHTHFRHNEIVQMHWKESRQPGLGELATLLLTVPLLLFSATPSFPLEPQYRVSVRTSVQAWTKVFHPAMEILTTPHQRLPTPWISSSSPPAPPLDSRIPSTPPVIFPPGIQSPSASDAHNSFAGFRAVDCSMRFRMEGAFRVIAKTTATASMLGVCSAA